MTTTFYLKYRPQKLSELDNTKAREELQKIFRSGKFPHAFLFTGPKGIGKTSAARIVAKAVNCERVYGLRSTDYGLRSTDYGLQSTEYSRQKSVDSSQTYEPCNECSACISITNGTNVDVLEIDAASNRGIDDIKELREKIKLAPSSLRYKVYIIDEVHMLTTEAFNALLKTLEEPPKHAIFILCTTDPEKLPRTIISRCVVVNFQKATQSEIVEKLKKICEAEKLPFEEPALEAISKLSDGSFRDANKILEQVSFAGKITQEEVEKVAGISREFKIGEFLLLLQNKQTKEALIWINEAVEKGINLKILTEKILDELRKLLLSVFGLEEPLTGLNFTREEVMLLINLFNQAYSELRFSLIPQLPLEMAIIEWGETGGEKCEVGGGKLEKEVENEKVDRSSNQNVPPRDPASHFAPHTSNFSLEDVIKKWPEILEKVKPLNHSVQAFLKAARPKECEGEFVVLEVFYKFHKDQLEKDQCRRIFEKVASEVLGQEIKLKCSLSERKNEPPPLPKIDIVPPEQKPNSPNQSGADIIKLAEEIFNKGGTVQ